MVASRSPASLSAASRAATAASALRCFVFFLRSPAFSTFHACAWRSASVGIGVIMAFCTSCPPHLSLCT